MTVTQIQLYVDQIDGILGEIASSPGLSIGAKQNLLRCTAITALILEEVSDGVQKTTPRATFIQSSTKAQNVVGESNIPHRNPRVRVDLDNQPDPGADANRASWSRDSYDPSDDSEFHLLNER